MQPPTGGTILTATSTGTHSTPEERPHKSSTNIKINNSTYTENLTGSPPLSRFISADPLPLAGIDLLLATSSP